MINKSSYQIQKEKIKGIERQVVKSFESSVVLLHSPYIIKRDNFALETKKEGYENVNSFGLPVWDTIVFTDDSKENGLKLKVNNCKIVLTQSKNIVTTPVVGLDGTIKEFISAGDGQLHLTVTIVDNTPDRYPFENVELLKNILDLNIPIYLESKILNRHFYIDNVVIISYSIQQQEEGMRNIQIFEIDAITDNPNIYNVISNINIGRNNKNTPQI